MQDVTFSKTQDIDIAGRTGHSHISEQIMMLNKISAILYQVTDYDTALEMIIDTCTEYFNVNGVAVLTEDKNNDHFHILKSRKVVSEIVNDFRFKANDKLNNKSIAKDEPTIVYIPGSQLRVNQNGSIQFGSYKYLYLFPVNFHDRLLGYLSVFVNKENSELNGEQVQLLEVFSVQISPILHTFSAIKNCDKNFESIISKIIRDRIYEAKLLLSPISFALFRITPTNEVTGDIPLDEIIKYYQKLIYKKINILGDIIWLTMDTIFFVYPKADLFKAEMVCKDLKQRIESESERGNFPFKLELHYVCLGYPQSGKNTSEIINNLWIRLFSELNTKNAKRQVTGFHKNKIL